MHQPIVGIHVDPEATMKHHAHRQGDQYCASCKNTSGAHAAALCCTKAQLLSMYMIVIWSALEVVSVCYAQGDSASLQRFQDSTQLGLAHATIDSTATRRKVAHVSMVYKQVVLR